MKTQIGRLALVLFLTSIAAFAADAAAVVDLPVEPVDFWVLAISVVTPLIVWGVATVAPKIPTVLLPSMTPLIGIALGLGLNALRDADLGWIDMAKAGALAVFVRETFNQAITKRLAGTPTVEPPIKPV